MAWITVACLYGLGYLSNSVFLFALYERLWAVGRMGFDCFQFYAASRAFQAGLNPYSGDAYAAYALSLSHGTWEAAGNLQPPPYYLLWLPLSQLPFGEAYVTFMAASWLVYLIALVLAARALLPSDWHPAALGLALGVASFPLPLCTDLNALGQVGLVVTALLAGVLVCLHRRWDRGAGVLWALAIVVKMHPLLFAVLFRRRLRLLTAAAVTLLLLALAVVACWGWWPFTAYLQGMAGEGYRAAINDQSLMGWFTKTLGQGPWLRPLHLLLAAIMVAVMVRVDAGQCPTASFGAYLIAMQLLSPWSFGHHHVLMVLGLILLWATSLQRPGALPWVMTAVTLVGLALEGEIVPVGWVAFLHGVYYTLHLGTPWMLVLWVGFVALTRSGSGR